LTLNPGAQAFVDSMNKTLKEELLVSADQLAVPMRFPTGSLSVDVILGGGWPGNQWAEIVGKSSAGKTFLALKSIAANQAADPGFTALWVAAEGYNNEWATALGVDNSRVVAVPTQRMETGFQVMLEAAESQAFGGIVLDSFPAMLVAEEADKAMDEFTTAAGARTFNRWLRKAGEASRRPYDGTGKPFFGIIINQYRDKIGGFSRFGVPQTTPGGNGKDYFFYTRVDVARKEFITEKRPGIKDAVSVGQLQVVKTIKNKSAAPQQKVEVPLYFRRAPMLGFERGQYDVAHEYFTMGVLLRVIGRSGAYYSFGDEQWQGEDKTKAAIRENANLQNALRTEVLEAAADPRRIDADYDG
jgi:recombination protein RecA